MHIYVPSLNRADNQITLASLTPRLLEHTTVVVNHDQGKLYHAVASDYGVKVLTCPATVNSSCTVRQYIVDQHNTKKLGPSLLMLDDDLRFFKRRTDDATKFLPVTNGELELCMNDMDRLMVKYTHGGILAREGGNRITDRIKLNTRLLRALAYNVEVLRKHKIKFDRGAMEDFDVTLQLLRLGYCNVALCSYVQDQQRSNAPGGCSTYRTPAYQAAWCKRLHELHPDFVKLVQKTTKVAWGGSERTDVVISWKKAYESSKCGQSSEKRQNKGSMSFGAI